MIFIIDYFLIWINFIQKLFILKIVTINGVDKMIEVSMFFGDPCPKCGHDKLNVIKELGLSKYECECENCKSVIIVDSTNNAILDENKK